MKAEAMPKNMASIKSIHLSPKSS